MVAILMMSGKIADLLKIKVFWNKGYDVIIISIISPTKYYQVIQII